MRWPSSATSAGASRSRLAALWLIVWLIACQACASKSQHLQTASDLQDPNAARYRLLLRDNPVDPGQAFRCYGQCQSQRSPQGYLQCIAACPGFEVTQGMRCADRDVPPVSACFTVRQIPKQSEPSAGWVVLAVIADVALIVTLASVCASSSAQCGYGYGYGYPPGPPPF
jgi:hypothetical protein